MAQFSVEIMHPTGSVLGGNQHHMSSVAVPTVPGPASVVPTVAGLTAAVLNIPGPTVAGRPKPIAKREVPVVSKSDLVLKKLRATKGVSLQQLADVTGWQLHSVRGFLSAVVRKKLELNLISDVGKDEVRRYRIVDDAASAAS